MNIKELDVIRLKDGRDATVLEVFKNGEAYLVEMLDDKGDVLDISIVESGDIKRIMWVN